MLKLSSTRVDLYVIEHYSVPERTSSQSELIMLPLSLAISLQAAADVAISKVLVGGGTHTRPPNGEVTAVRTMTLDGFDEIAACWSPVLRSAGYRIDLRAVFCHSRPHVTFAPVPHPKHPGGKSTRRCELADLLIVIDHFDPFQKIDDRRAVLVQAKLLKGGMVRPSGPEWVQHELLEAVMNLRRERRLASS